MVPPSIAGVAQPEVLLEGLDGEQRAAVTSTAMPLVVLAPAGSGKTRVLTRRIAYRIATGEADPRHVLALTFTRKAAGELDERLRRLGLRGDTTTGTFHAVAWATLRTRWADQGRQPPALLDHKGAMLRELAPTVVGKDRRTVTGALVTEIEWAKARMVTPDAYVDAVVAASRRPVVRPELIAETYAAYEHRKRRGGLVDFDDLLALVARDLEEDATFAAAQRWRFRHLFVDELQDVNPLQFRLLEAWRGDRYDVTAVGDPLQAIYGWNGADAGFLLDIHRWWPPAEVVELTRCYRSTPEILEAAGSVLGAGRLNRRPVQATRSEGKPPLVRGYPDDRAEAVAIARAIRFARAPGRPWSEQAVLVRTHAQTQLIAEALRDAGIPHRVRGAAAFLDRPEIRGALRELRDANVPLGTALADLEEHVEAREQEALRELDRLGADEETRAARRAELADSRAAMDGLVRMGRDYLRLDPNGRADSLASWLRATVPSEEDAAGSARDGVDVATFHAAKGLEWTTVHLAGVEDGFVPIAHARTAAAKAEEVRLLYVAMTRAERDLRITFAEQRTLGGRAVARRPSPLIEPVIDRSLAGEREPATPDTEDGGWLDELARQRDELRAAAGTPPELDALRAWRAEAARAARVDPDSVLPDHVLARVAAEHPIDVDALGAVRGVGPILADRLGEQILRALESCEA